MRLSRKGWNNVIIFSMLIMIFFLNGLHKKIGSDETQAQLQPLLPVQSFVLTLEFSDQKIERIGTSWRTTALIKEVLLFVSLNCNGELGFLYLITETIE